MKTLKTKLGFTLAEVLVTLGVIGIVATMTIPTLVQNYQSKAWDTAQTTFNRKLGEALKIMNTQETLAGYSSTEDFVKELSRHLKITKTCDNKNLTACFDNKVMWDDTEVDISELSTSADMGKADWKTNIVGFQMANGVTGLVAYNPACTQDPYNNKHINISGSTDGKKGKVKFPGTDCIAMVYDVTGYAKPNTKGDAENPKDISANIDTLAKAKSCFLELGGKCWGEPFAPTAISKQDCDDLIKSGYGIKACNYESDYWAGAVKACGGTTKMPTPDQLAQLATQIYGETIGKTDYKTGLTIKDQTLYDAFAGGSYFYVWSSEATNSNVAYTRYFGDTDSYYYYDNFRNDSTILAVCLID